MTATAQQLEYLKNSIKSIQDYPKPGILFRDVTSLLEDPKAYALSIDLLVERYKNAGITKVVGTEARGFLFGAPVALGLGVGFVPVRKPGKLPRETISETYDLEYGTDQLEIHVDAIKPGDKVLVVDDLLANSVSKNRALPATALSRSRAINYRQSCAAHATGSTRCAFSLAVLTGLC